MKNFPVDLDAMTEGERELFLEMEREEQAEIDRYLNDPVLMKKALAYKAAVDEMLQERADGDTSITFSPDLSETEIDSGFEHLEKLKGSFKDAEIYVFPDQPPLIVPGHTSTAAVEVGQVIAAMKSIDVTFGNRLTPETIGRTHKKKSAVEVEIQLAAAAAGKKKEYPQG